MFNAMTSAAGGDEAARRAHLLVYDIPKSCKLANPSQMLWRFGVRINLSCWLVPDSRVPMLPLAEWEAAGMKVELVRFDERDGETILRLARNGLMAEVGRWREALDDATNTIREQCDSVRSVGDESRERVRKTGNLISFHLNRARRFNVSARECALAFDLLGDVERVLDGLRDVIRAKEELMKVMHDEAKRRSEPLPAPAKLEPADPSELVPNDPSHAKETTHDA